jgi:hypothetical protein
MKNNMEFAQLGRTGLKVSRLCLGAMNFGPQRSEEDSFAIMVRGWNSASTVSIHVLAIWLIRPGLCCKR